MTAFKWGTSNPAFPPDGACTTRVTQFPGRESAVSTDGTLWTTAWNTMARRRCIHGEKIRWVWVSRIQEEEEAQVDSGVAEKKQVTENRCERRCGREVEVGWQPGNEDGSRAKIATWKWEMKVKVKREIRVKGQLGDLILDYSFEEEQEKRRGIHHAALLVTIIITLI